MEKILIAPQKTKRRLGSKEKSQKRKMRLTWINRSAKTRCKFIRLAWKASLPKFPERGSVEAPAKTEPRRGLCILLLCDLCVPTLPTQPREKKAPPEAHPFFECD